MLISLSPLPLHPHRRAPRQHHRLGREQVPRALRGQGRRLQGRDLRLCLCRAARPALARDLCDQPQAGVPAHPLPRRLPALGRLGAAAARPARRLRGGRALAARRTDVPDARARAAGLAPKPVLKADRAAGVLILDSETRLAGVPAEAWDYRLGNRTRARLGARPAQGEDPEGPDDPGAVRQLPLRRPQGARRRPPRPRHPRLGRDRGDRRGDAGRVTSRGARGVMPANGRCRFGAAGSFIPVPVESLGRRKRPNRRWRALHRAGSSAGCARATEAEGASRHHRPVDNPRAPAWAGASIAPARRRARPGRRARIVSRQMPEVHGLAPALADEPAPRVRRERRSDCPSSSDRCQTRASSSSAAACTRRSPAAITRPPRCAGPPRQSLTMPPAASITACGPWMS